MMSCHDGDRADTTHNQPSERMPRTAESSSGSGGALAVRVVRPESSLSLPNSVFLFSCTLPFFRVGGRDGNGMV